MLWGCYAVRHSCSVFNIMRGVLLQLQLAAVHVCLAAKFCVCAEVRGSQGRANASQGKQGKQGQHSGCSSTSAAHVLMSNKGWQGAAALGQHIMREQVRSEALRQGCCCLCVLAATAALALLRLWSAATGAWLVGMGGLSFNTHRCVRVANCGCQQLGNSPKSRADTTIVGGRPESS